MMRKFKRSLALVMTAILMLTSMPVRATESEEAEQIIEEETEQTTEEATEQTTEEKTEQTTKEATEQMTEEVTEETTAVDETEMVTSEKETESENEEAVSEEITASEAQTEEADISKIPDEIFDSVKESFVDEVLNVVDEKLEAEAYEDTAKIMELVESELKSYVNLLLERQKDSINILSDGKAYEKVYDSLYEKMYEVLSQMLGAQPDVMSLQPLKEERIEVDLKNWTPMELTMVPLSKIFEGKDMSNVSKISYCPSISQLKDFQVMDYAPDKTLNLLEDSGTFQIITSDNQLDTNATRYIVYPLTSYDEWLNCEVYEENEEGKLEKVEVKKTSTGYFYGRNKMYNDISLGSAYDNTKNYYVKLSLKDTFTESSNRSEIKVFKGEYLDASQAEMGEEITDIIFGNTPVTDKTDLYLGRDAVTFVTYNENNKVTGCISVVLYLRWKSVDKSYNIYSSLYKSYKAGTTCVSSGWDSYLDEFEIETHAHTLYEGYPANGKYIVKMYSYEYDEYDISKELTAENITAAFVGQYSTIAQAKTAGAADIKDKLFKEVYQGGGYEADYSEGVYFTVFIGDDGSNNQEVFKICVKAKEGVKPENSGADVTFTGICNDKGNYLNAYVIKTRDSSMVFKYQKAELIYKEILNKFAEISGNGNMQDIKQRGATRVCSFMSINGGAGASTIAVAYAIKKAESERVLYLNFENFGSADYYFEGEGNYGLDELLYTIKTKKGSLEIKIDSVVKKSKENVFFFSDCKNANEIRELEILEIHQLLDALCKCGRFDLIVLDIENEHNLRLLEFAKYSDKIFVVADGTEISNVKFERYLNSIKVFEEKNAIALLNKMNIIYNKYSNKSSVSLSNSDITVIGGIPKYEKMAVKDMIENIKEKDFIVTLI